MNSFTTNLSGYRLTKQIYAGSRTVVYQAIREADHYPVVLKLLREEYPSFEELVRFRNQYVIAQNIKIPGVVKLLALERYRQGHVLVMEDVGGVSLANYLKDLTSKNHQNYLSLEVFLNIGVQLADTLLQLHRCRVIHKDIKPANILIQPETKQVKLIDFSISSILPRETQKVQSPNILEGTLAYLSPEQTGRMNRVIDYRSDFYSLGITFYELLTGQLPFVADDPMELIHCHIAKYPKPVFVINNTVPQVVSDIISKLMAKNAEERYQSALGLKHDLQLCLEAWKKTGNIAPFVLGQMDWCDRFMIPEKLYGRESEVQQLLAAFERISEGTAEIMLVAGFSGIGKTVVVNEVHKPIVRQRGYFIKGKFDQFNRNVPLSAFVQAFRELIGQLLCEPDTQLAQWKRKILTALGENAQVIVDVIPELEQLIGKQPPVAELSGIAAQNRFNLLFLKFIQVLTIREHPLVIFLDDLQWADSASLNLMQVLMSQREAGYLLLIGAYRDNEVSPAHPLMLTLDKLCQANITVNTINLTPLSQSSLNQLVADTLQCTESIAQPLTQLIYQKTRGNPFFSTQFLKALHEEGWIEFDSQTGHWQCDITQIQLLSLTDDVVEFVAMQLQKLPQATQNVLKLAACIGNQFDLATLAVVCEQSETQTAALLWKALQEGLILPQTEIYKFYQQQTLADHRGQTPSLKEGRIKVRYKFLHDRVQQAAYSLIKSDEKQTVHLKIGQLLLSNTAKPNQEEHIFELVGQFNVALELITQAAERQTIAQLNLIASRKAIAATAYAAALKYATVGIGLLLQNSWHSQYQLTLELHQVAAEAAYLSGDLQQMETFANLVLSYAKTPLAQTPVYEIKIEVFTAQQQFALAIADGLCILQKLGVEFPEDPSPEDVAAALQLVLDTIGDRTPADLLDLSEVTDSNILAATQILMSLIPSAFIYKPLLFPLVCLKKVYLSIIHGNTPTSSFTYAVFGLLFCKMIGNVELGYEFGQLALDLLSRQHNSAIKVKTIYTVYTFTRYWKIHVRDLLPALQTNYLDSLDLGDLSYAGYSAYAYVCYAYVSGQTLVPLESEISKYCDALKHLQQTLTLMSCLLVRQITLNLMGEGDNVLLLKGIAYDEEEQIVLLEGAGGRSVLALLWIHKMALSYLFSAFEEAVEQANQARQYFDACISIDGVFFHFYESLVYLALLPSISTTQRQQMEKRIADNQEQLKYWATHGPMNFQHKYDLVEAERYRVLGQRAEAIEYYDQAIATAKENGYIQEEALGNELAARFYLEWGKETVAASYMQKAHYCYSCWGAKAKTADLENRYPHLLEPILNQPKLSFNPLESLASSNLPSNFSSTFMASANSSFVNAFDFASILKAAQAISSSIELQQLICHLTHIILENAGAETCVLLLPSAQEWQIRAITRLEGENSLPVTQLQTTTLEGSTEVPVRLIQYVRRTHETVIIDNNKTEVSGVIGEYMLKHQPQSVLCTPILNQGSLIGVLYLEHRSVKGIFTRDRLLVTTFLCSQAAISLENARLYQQSQQALTDLQTAQLQLVQSEKMSALGNLVAGVAHEINNPVGFISGNLNEARQTIHDLLAHIELYRSGASEVEIVDHAEEIDLDYLIEDLPKMIESMKVGCDRIKSISTSLRIFSRADQNYPVTTNIHDGIDSTILILKHRLKANESRPAIEVTTEYGKIPTIECFPGQLNQVFMNILSNAIDALEESNVGRSFMEIQAQPNWIRVKTELSSDQESVIIRIQDNGIGIAKELKQKIFNHLFTTKGVGKGTGLGLAIARQIIVEKHGGMLTVNSELGMGTEFVLTLPVKTNH